MLPRLPWIIQWAILVFALFGVFVAFGFVQIAAVALWQECSRRLRFRRGHGRRRSASLAAGPESPPATTPMIPLAGDPPAPDGFEYPGEHPATTRADGTEREIIYPGEHPGTGYNDHVHHWEYYPVPDSRLLVEACQICGKRRV